MDTFLGIDGGGTRTRAVLIDSDGNEIGRGEGGPCNIASCTDDALARSILDAVVAARVAQGAVPSPVRCVCAGVAGYSVETRRLDFIKLLPTLVSAHAYRVEPDYAIAFWGATHGEPGIVVVAGTGSVAYGMNDAGQTYRADGLGYLLGDRGSGFDLGLYALRYALRSMQENRHDALTAAVLSHTGATRQSEIMSWLYGNFSPSRVASLSPVIGKLAEAGDPNARNLTSEMARRLRHTVREVRHKLWLPRDTPVYPLGGLWQLGEFFRVEFQQPVWDGANGVEMTPEPATGGYFNLTEPKSDAAYGAALMAKLSGGL